MHSNELKLSKQTYDAAIFDMDGVLTRTAQIHAAAWKKMFDDFLAARSQQCGESFQPFSIEDDYYPYVDGKPRHDGIRAFLSSRGIEIPDGDPDDDAEQETLYGLGRRKNREFLQQLDTKGAECYQDAVVLLSLLRKAGFKLAVISSSKNAAKVLAQAGLDHFFQVRVDGLVSQERGLAGKPAPDIFLEAARELSVSPQRTLVVEDAQAGVEAARAGEFGLVTGLARDQPADQLAQFADLVVTDLSELKFTTEALQTDTRTLPSAIQHFGELTQQLGKRQPAVFIDYDGTLTPIVDRPEQATISAQMRRAVSDLAKHCTVAIISGRDRADVQHLAGIEGIYYAGSHGFDIAGPAGEQLELQQGTDYLPALEKAANALENRLKKIDGAQVERKKFAIAVHFRRVDQERHQDVIEIVADVAAEHTQLRKTGGKMIVELRPDIDWDKGKALRWLLKKLDLNRPDIAPLYLGDDLTDEDALSEIATTGIGILVRDESRPTYAHYALEDPKDVGDFLMRLCKYLSQQDDA